MKKSNSRITELINDFQSTIAHYLPQLEKDVASIIEQKETNTAKIERYLDTLFSLSQHGVDSSSYDALLNYYQEINHKGAELYKKDLDN